MGRKVGKKQSITATVAVTATLAGLVIAGAGTAAQATVPPPPHVLAGSVAPFTSHVQVTGIVEPARKLTIQLWLTPQTAAAEAYATAVSTPGSPLYEHYLSPAAYTSRFGPTAAEAAAAESWLRSQGFTAVAADAQRDYVTGTASAAAVDAAFRTQLKYYKPSASVNAGRYRLFANSSALTIPSSLASIVTGVTGVDNAAPVLPLIQRKAARPGATAPADNCSRYWGQHAATVSLKQNGTNTYPTVACGYSARQLRSAYGANTANVGTGRTIALVELGLTPGMFGTLRRYAASNGMPAPSGARYKELSLGGTLAACGDPFYGEESLDVEAAYDMAPGATELVVGGDGCDTGFAGLQGLFDADLAVLNGNGTTPLATVASNSWGSGGEGQASVITSIEHAYLVKAAAEGVGEYFSSGDGSGVFAPASDPYAIAIGGTTLGIGKTGNRVFETGWSTNAILYDSGVKAWVEAGEDGAAGGGPSLLWTQPGYQSGVVPTALATVAGNRGGALVRSAPDISADADPVSGMLVLLQILNAKGGVNSYLPVDIGGTSLAAPLVAGMVTAAEQGQVTPFGFIDPAIYALASTPAITDALPVTATTPASHRQAVCGVNLCGDLVVFGFDDQSFTMAGYNGQVTLKGYDNMTGVGMPAGQAFIAALRNLLK